MRVKHDRVVVDAMAAVNDDPDEAVRLATSVIDAADASDEERIKARWARGMARRERGEMALGADDLFAARQEAVAQHDSVLAARIDTTLAAVALYTGSADGAFEILDQAQPHLRGPDLARLETQRGLILHRSGALREASAQYLSALRHFREGRDDVGLARLLLNLGILHAERGELAKSVNRLAQAADVAAGAGQRLMAAGARHNLGYARSRAGRLSEALDDLQAAEVDYREIGRTDYAAVAQADRAVVLVHCNLVDEACLAADLAAAGLRAHGNETEFADAELLAARCRLAAGRLDAARAAAAESSASFRRQHRSAWEAMADYVETEIVARDEPTAATAQTMQDVARRLEEYGWSSEAAAARVRAGQLLLAAGETEQAGEILGGLRVVADRPAGERAAAHLARALLADARRDRRRARAAVRQGLQVVAETQTSLGALEFRSFAAGHGEALVELGSRLAISDHRPSELLDRVEATRRTVWLAPRATPPSDEVLAALLAQLRAVTEDLRAAVGGGSDPADLRRRRVELEREVRDHTRRGRASGDVMTVGVRDAVAALGDQQLLEYATVDGQLYAVTVSGRRARLHELGPNDGLADDIDACTFALHRLNRTQGSAASKDAARRTLGELGHRLADRLVPARVRRSERPLIVVPTGALHGLAWGALPGLAGRSVSVSPSLIGWAVAQAARSVETTPPGVLLAAGPDLPAAPTEVKSLAPLYRSPTTLVGDAATADAVLHGLGRCGRAHLACHGSFRSDNPLFSTLSLADGPLTVYDLERCRTMPRTVVLSACSVATSAVLRGGTLLGLASALMTFGASTIIAPLTPVNDERVVPVMVQLHRAMTDGAPPATALAGTVVGDDSELDPTAAAFVAIGA